MSRIPISLDEKALAGLAALAKQEYRDLRQQAAVIIRQELSRLGFLAVETQANIVPIDKSSTKNPKHKQARLNAAG